MGFASIYIILKCNERWTLILRPAESSQIRVKGQRANRNLYVQMQLCLRMSSAVRGDALDKRSINSNMESELSGMRKRPPQQTSTHFCQQRRRQLRSPRTVGGWTGVARGPARQYLSLPHLHDPIPFLLSEPPRFLDFPFGTQRISDKFLFARKRTGLCACAWRIVRSAGRLR